LDRGGRYQNGRARIAEEVLNCPMPPSRGIPCVMGLVNNDEIELDRRLKPDDAARFAPPLRVAEEKTLIKQRKGKDRFSVPRRPTTFQPQLLDAVPQCRAIQFYKVLIESLHLRAPFALHNQRLRADYENRFHSLSRLKLLDDQTRLDRLPYTNVIRDEQAWTIGADQFQNRPELIGLILDPTAIKRIEPAGCWPSGEVRG